MNKIIKFFKSVSFRDKNGKIQWWSIGFILFVVSTLLLPISFLLLVSVDFLESFAVYLLIVCLYSSPFSLIYSILKYKEDKKNPQWLIRVALYGFFYSTLSIFLSHLGYLFWILKPIAIVFTPASLTSIFFVLNPDITTILNPLPRILNSILWILIAIFLASIFYGIKERNQLIKKHTITKKHFLLILFLLSLFSFTAFVTYAYSSSDIHEIAKCELNGGIWRIFPNGCGDYCIGGSSESVFCTMALQASCDCGPNKCWSGESCEPVNIEKVDVEDEV